MTRDGFYHLQGVKMLLFPLYMRYVHIHSRIINGNHHGKTIERKTSTTAIFSVLYVGWFFNLVSFIGITRDMLTEIGVKTGNRCQLKAVSVDKIIVFYLNYFVEILIK
jgi:hypothetical protein